MASTATNISYVPQQYSQDQQQQYFPRQRPLHHIIPIRPYPPEFNQTTFIRTNNNNNSNPLNLPQSFRARWIFPSQMYGYNFTLSQSYGFVRGEYRNSPTIQYSQMPMNIQPQQQQQPPPSLEIPPWHVRFMSESSAHLTSEYRSSPTIQYPQMPMNIQPQQQQPPSLGIPPWHVRFMSGSSAHLTSGIPLYFPPPVPVPPPPLPLPIPLPVPPPPAKHFIQNHNNNNNNFQQLIDSNASEANVEKRNENSTPATINTNLNSKGLLIF
uniref:Uncharacterized protein n=1 Tax=Panagrolaimus sp. PS1159 TaxID=55785 RepID=A0AC35EZA1_9BILA